MHALGSKTARSPGRSRPLGGKLLFALCASLAWADSSPAQLPVALLSGVFPPGGRQGESVEISLSGSDLDSVDRLLFSHPGLSGQPKLRDPDEFETGPQPIPNQFKVTIAADVPPGCYELRAVGKYGVSNPRIFAVGNQTEALEVEPNETHAAAQPIPLDAVVNGRSNRGGDLDYYRFTVRAGQRVLIECRARPLDSRLDAAVAVYDAAGRELAREYDGSLHDTLVDFLVPADGDYVVQLHDFIYGGGEDYVYRLSLSTHPRVDFVFPPAGLPGSTANYQLYGRNLPGGKPAPGAAIDGKPLEVVTARIELSGGAAEIGLPAETLIEPAESGLDAMAYRLQTPAGLADPVLIGFATAPVVVEQEPNDIPDKAQKISLPCECAGQFYPQGDQDWFTFDARQGEKYVIEVISQRQGSIADPFLLIEQITSDQQGKEQVKELKSEDDVGETAADPDFDTRHDDPIYRFTAPADGVYRVLVRDLYFGSRGDPRFVYRLVVRPEEPDFRLVALPKFSGSQANANQQPSLVWSPLLRKGGTELIEAVALRRDGFDGEITITAEGLPPGVTAEPASIGPGDRTAAVVLKAADDAPAATASFRLVGRAKIGGKEIAREARAASLVWAGQQRRTAARSRLSHALALAVSDVEQAPFLIEAKDAAWEMSRAGKLEIPLSVTRRDGFAGPLQLTVSGLPKGFQRANNLTVDGKSNTAKLTLNVPANAPLGSFSFYVRATAKHSYRRNPEAAAAASERKAELGRLASELAAAVKSSADAKQTAEKKAADAEQLADKAAKQLDDAGEAAAATEADVKAAALALDKAKKAAEDKLDDKELAAVVVEAEKQLNEAEVQASKTAETKTAAEKTAAESSQQAKAARDEQTAAIQSLAAAEAKVKSIEKAKAAADKAASQAADAAKPKSVNIGFPSTLLTLAITPAPVAISTTSTDEAIIQGSKLEIPLQVRRLYRYADPVQISVNLPKGVTGLKVAPIAVPKDGTEAKLVIEAASNATLGTHELTIQATARFNNQSLQTTQAVQLTVEEAKKP